MTHRNGGRILNVKALARVEGEGALHVAIHDGAVVDAQLNIYEPPRFFEAFLRGRAHTEPPDITARICGICPVAYQMSSCLAIEDACGVKVDGQLRDLRRLLYCGEWIESHALHIYMLHAPDFLGYASVIEMAEHHRSIVERGLRLKKIGNQILEVIGGRAIHPINVKVGGFYRVPSRNELRQLIPDLEWSRAAATKTIEWVSTFPFPDYEGDWDFISLAGEPSFTPRKPQDRDGPIAEGNSLTDATIRSDTVKLDRTKLPHEEGSPAREEPLEAGELYPIMADRITSLSGRLEIPVADFLDHISEEQVPHSTALHGRWPLDNYLVGPLARYNNSQHLLPPIAQESAARAGLGAQCRNPYQSIIVRAVEILAVCDEALRLIEQYEPPDSASIEVAPRAGVGHGATEAPRGLLYHRYEIDEQGTILDATIVPPTSQNQRAVEHDLSHVVEANLGLDDAALTHRCEQTIRNYDPCISCATHFLDVHMEFVNEPTGSAPTIEETQAPGTAPLDTFTSPQDAREVKDA
jgi:sulfhydrogenase subunit alpha